LPQAQAELADGLESAGARNAWSFFVRYVAPVVLFGVIVFTLRDVVQAIRRLRHGHAPRPTLQGFFRGPFHLRRDLYLDLRQLPTCHPFAFEVLFVESDGVAATPILIRFRRNDDTGLPLVVGGVTTHAEGLGGEDHGAVATATAIGRKPGGSERI
jgi:hypothetical protein